MVVILSKEEVGAKAVQFSCRCARLREGRYRKRYLERASSVLTCIAINTPRNHEDKLS